jgi:DNA adenine methylase
MHNDTLPIESTRAVAPFLKWIGGKRWLAPHLNDILPRHFNRYFEPFLGGGALFFYLRPWPATLSDINEELINTYRQVRDNVDEVIERLSKHAISQEVFETVRRSRPKLNVTRAVRFLYLNRTAFNGIYRVNRDGRFNVPFGCKPGTVICDADQLQIASRALSNRQLLDHDFEDVINRAQQDDFIYVDPPYTSSHNNNGFRRYNERIFSWSDQIRLAAACHRAVKRGASVIVSNADHREVIALYDNFDSKKVKRYSSISGIIRGRSTITETVLYSPAGR